MGFSWDFHGICLMFSPAFWSKKSQQQLPPCRPRNRWTWAMKGKYGAEFRRPAETLECPGTWKLENPMENPRGCHWCHHFPDFYKARNGGIPKLWGKPKKNRTTLASPITKKTWRHQQSPNSLRSHQLTVAKQHTDMKGIEATEWRLDQIELGGIATLYILYIYCIHTYNIYIHVYIHRHMALYYSKKSATSPLRRSGKSAKLQPP